jgi:hypothetical protein
MTSSVCLSLPGPEWIGVAGTELAQLVEPVVGTAHDLHSAGDRTGPCAGGSATAIPERSTGTPVTQAM